MASTVIYQKRGNEKVKIMETPDLSPYAIKADVDAELATKADATDVAVNTKRVDNVFALLNGALSVQNTDSTSAYAKTVPSKAQPYAAIDAIGGKTLCWNQGIREFASPYLVVNPNYGTGTYNSDGTITYTLTINGTNGAIYQPHAYGFILLDTSHKYFVSIDIKTSKSLVRMMAESPTVWYKDWSITANTRTTLTEIFSPNQNATSRTVYVYPFIVGGEEGDTATLYGWSLVDLTLMFGAGNEPSTVAEFTAMFPTIDPAYNAGTLISAGVTGAVSDPHNIAIPSVINATGAHVYLDADIIRRHFISPGDCITVYVYKMSDGTSVGGDCSLNFWKDSTNLDYATMTGNRRMFFQSGASGTGEVDIDAIRPDYNKVSIYVPSALRNIDLGVVICAGATTISAYIPSRAPATLPIPAAVQSLPGYGWSAGSVYNEVDWVNKKYIQRVGSVDLGSKTWTSDGSSYPGMFRTTISGIKYLGNLLCVRYPCYQASGSPGNLPDKHITVGNSQASPLVRIKDTDYNNETQTTDFKTSLSGVYLYYELATPIETDISAYLSDDNLIVVEPGGTLTFPSQLGDDYRIPVPSGVEYTIDLAPDTPSTDGTYTLQCTVTDGVATYSWVSA